MKPLQRAAEALLSLLYPPHCAGCGAGTPAGIHLCEPCAAGVRRIHPPCCQKCSQPFEGCIEGPFTCPNCRDQRFHFECAVAACLSRGLVRELIHRFKYNRAYYLRHPLAALLAETLQDPRIRSQPFDFLVPVPLHPAREREREYNQAEALASLLSRRCATPLLPCLRRLHYTTTQTRLSRRTRRQNLRNAFRVRQTARVSGSRLLLVDDVFTTGSTVEECARLLCEAGAASVRVITVARG